MNVNINDLKRLIESIVDKCEDVNETVFYLDPKEPNLGQKVDKIKNDTGIFDKNKDKVVVGGAKIGTDVQTEEYTKGEIMNAISEAKTYSKFGGNKDYMKAIKKADRELDYELDGPGWKAKHKIHKDKTKYNRKSNDDFDIDECVLETTVKDIKIKMLENKHNGVVYSGSEFKKQISKK